MTTTTVAYDKKQLLSQLLLNVKSCQSRFGSRTELATEDDTFVRQLCVSYENVFFHGFKKTLCSQSSGLWQMTENLVPAGLRNSETYSFWPLIKSQLSKHEAERFLLLHNVRTDLGRSRAWLRASLNEHSLERYIHIFLSLHNLSFFYEDHAFLRDVELSSILPQTAAGLGSILFALVVDHPELDKKTTLAESNVESPVAQSVTELAEIADETMNEPQNTNPGSKLKKVKKKKKIPTSYVTFGDDETRPSALTNAPNPVPPEVKNMQSSSKVSDEAEQDNPQLLEPVSQTSAQTPSVTVINTVVAARTSPKDIRRQARQEDDSYGSIYSSSVKSADNLSLYSDASDRLDVENLSISEISPSIRLKPVGMDGSGLLNYSGDPERTQDLIPVPNYSNDEDESDTDSPNKMVNKVKNSSNTEDHTTSSNDVEDDERIHKLKTILENELEVMASLKAELADSQRKFNDQTKILEAKVETLTKENALLKHQLKKYVGAVQLLKHTKRLSLDEEDILETISLNEQATEGAEYERKLIQVAEMHGELMEFNTHLQSVLQRKEQALRTLQAELEDLRGPLGPGQTGDDDSSLDIDFNSSLNPTINQRHVPFTRQQTLNERVLINIWIPSAFLTGATNDLHHVYQVFLRIKDTEWNVYRRYSDFYAFHRDLKKQDAVINSFYFPPKKHIGNKDTKFVDERRRKLQDYLRNVINRTLQTNSILSVHPDKNLLISILPFFGETIQPSKPKRSKSRTRNLFFRQADSSEPQFLQGSTLHSQYTGL